MQNDKQTVLRLAKHVYQGWQDRLSSLSSAQIHASLLPTRWTTKDVVAHLWSWQQRSIARLEAGQAGRKPQFPAWPAGLDPNAHDVQRLNDWLYEQNRLRPWQQVHADWQAGFQRLLALGEAIPQPDLETPGRYAWLPGHSLAYIIFASCDHHQEHLGELNEGLR